MRKPRDRRVRNKQFKLLDSDDGGSEGVDIIAFSAIEWLMGNMCCAFNGVLRKTCIWEEDSVKF